MEKIFIVITLFYTCACATTQLQPLAPFAEPAFYAERVGFRPQRQLVVVARDGQRQSFTALVEVGTEQITVVGFGAFGVRLFALNWTREAVEYQPNPSFDPLLDPRTIYRDMQFALASDAQVQQERTDSLKIEISDKKERVFY